MMNTVNTIFSFVEVWFTNQTSKALEIEDNVNLTLTNYWVDITKMTAKIWKILSKIWIFVIYKKLW